MEQDKSINYAALSPAETESHFDRFKKNLEETEWELSQMIDLGQVPDQEIARHALMQLKIVRKLIVD